MNIDPAILSILAVLLVQTAGVSYWLGVLSNRVATNAVGIAKLQSGDDVEGARRSDVIERLVRLETQGESHSRQTEAMMREVRGLSRQVATLATSGRPGVVNFMDAQSDD